MKLYKYFESLEPKEFNDSYYYMIGDFSDYQKIKDYYNLLTVEEIRNIKKDPLFEKHQYILNKLGIINTKELIDVDNLLSPKKIQPPYLILLKEKSFESYKKYKSIDDLVNDNDVAIYFQDNYQKNVYCYNLKTLECLFFANLSKQSHNAYGSWAISRAVSAPEIAGKNILYPIMAYYSGGIISSSRDAVKEVARYVWKDFYDDSSDKIKRFFPIDDMDFTITPSEEDDGVIFIKTQYDYNDILSIFKEEINKMNIEDKKIFEELLLVENNDQLKSLLNSSNNNLIKKLKTHFEGRKNIVFKKTTTCDKKDFIYLLLTFITKKLYDQLQAIDVLEKIQGSFLNWTYELKDSSIVPKIKTLMKRHQDTFKEDSSAKKRIVKSADELWNQRY